MANSGNVFVVEMKRASSVFNAKPRVPAVFDATGQRPSGIGGGVYAPPYEGAYTVTPNTETQTLETKGKYLSENVQVEPVPYEEIENEYGGITVYIGGNQ